MPPVIQVRGRQYEQLVDALVDAYPGAGPMAMMLQFRLGKNLAVLAATNNPLPQVAFDVIQQANAQGWTGQLIAAARESNPGNPKLLKLAQDFGLTAASPELERLVRDDLAFLDITQWRQRLGEIEVQVCRVETPDSMGTGFLVGPDLILTNYHVVEAVIKNPAHSANVALRFDYKRLADGTTLNPGTEFRLAKKWLVDSSPYSPVDLLNDPGDQTPAADQLDYALLRLSDDPGNQSVGDRAEPNAPKRGWLKPRQPFAFVAKSPIFIIQHPKAGPLKLAMDTQGVLSTNSNKTRVRYVTNTEAGSSGSPVFNENWDLVALHHSGDRQIVPTFNEGVPFEAIVTLLEQRGAHLGNAG